MSGRIVKLQNKNVLNPFDPSGDTELNLFPVSVIKGIYDEDNLRLDRALQKIAVYNVSLGDVKSGTTTQYDAISNAIEAVYIEATNKSTLAKINPGSLISFLDKDNKYELWQYNSALTDETSIKNADNWVKLESSGDLSDVVKRIVALEADNTTNKANITTLFSTCASLSQAITDIKVDIANLKTECQKLEDSKVDKYSTSHYYNITSSKYSYTLQRIVSVPDNDGIYGTIEMSFSGRSGYSIYNDLLFMNANESQKVISLVTDLFYTITEMIDSKQYVTLCAINQFNPRNSFQFNIDISKYSSAYNKTIEITGDDRPDKSFIWYDDTNSTNRNLNLSDVTSAIAAGDYTKYLSYKKGLVIKSSFATSDLNPVDACTLTITSADDTNGYKGADFVQYKDFIVKWDISSNGGLSKIKLLSHTTTSTDELGNTTSSTSYYDTSKIYRISPTKTMSNFILVGPADATNTALNDNVVLIDYESIIPAGSIITLTPPASSTETWLIDVKTPDIYAKENSIVVSQDTEGKSAIGRDVRKTTFKTSYDTYDKLETYLKTRLTDSRKYIPIIKIPFDGKSLHCHFGLSMSIAFPSMDPQFSGDLFLNVNKSDFYSETCAPYIRFNFVGHLDKTNILSLDDDVIANIAVMFADKDDNFLTSNDITSDVKYAYICLLDFLYNSTTGTLSNYITEGSISLYDVPDGTITANESTESTDLMYGIKGLKSLTYINQFPMYASCFCSDYYINKILTQCNNLETTKQDKLTFDTTPTKDSTNPVTSGGLKTALDAITLTAGSGIQIDSNRINYKVFNNTYTVNNDNGEITLVTGTTLPVYYYSKVLTIAFKEEGSTAAYGATFIVGASNWSTVNENKLGIYQMFFSYHTESAGVDHAVMNTISGYDDKTLFAYTVDQVTKSDATELDKNGAYDIVNVYIRATVDTLTPDGKGGYKTTYQNPSTNITVLNQSFHGRLGGVVSNNVITYLNSDYIWYGVEKDYVNSNTNSNWYTSSSNTAALSLQSWTTTKPVGTYTFTKIPGYEIKDYNEQVQFKMYQFDTTPTAGSTNPVTSDGISAVLKKKCSIVSEITVVEQLNLSNPVDRGIYIIKKIDSTSTTPEYGSTDSFGGSCLLPHLAIYYKDSDGIFKHAHLPIGDTKSYTSITISSNILTLTKNDGSVETITLPSVQSAQSDWSTTDTSDDSYILNKPTKLSSFDNDSGYDTVSSVNSKLASCLPLAGGTLTGDLIFSDSKNALKGIYGSTGNNDAWRLIGGSTETDTGWLELASSNGGKEPIYVRQYASNAYGLFGNRVRSATLLDRYGNTSFPGTVTASAFSGNASSATKLATARSITLSGNTNGTATFDGSDNITIATSTDHALSASLDGSGHDIESTYATKTELSSYLPLTGNAATATKATQDGSGNVITSTYLSVLGGSLHGPLMWNAGSLPTATSLSYILGVDSFAEGGTTRWCNASSVTVGQSYSSNFIKSNTWNWSGVGPQGTGTTVRKIASITDMSYLEIDGGTSVGTEGTKGIVKIIITYIDGIIISNNSTTNTNFGYVITSKTIGNNGKVNIDLYLQERDDLNYYNIFVSKLVGSSISFESPSIAAVTAPSGYVAIS